MKKNTFYFILTLLMIPIFGLIVCHNFSNIGKNFQSFKDPGFDFPEIKDPAEGMKKDFLEQNSGYKEYRDPDRNIKFLYPASWIETDPRMLASINQQMDQGKGKILFSALYVDPLKGDSVYLIVERLEYSDIDNLLEALSQDASSRSLKLEVCKKEELGEKTLLDLKYYSVFSQADPNSVNFLYFAREAAVFVSGKAYLVAVISAQEEWNEADQASQGIMDSIEILNTEGASAIEELKGPVNTNGNTEQQKEDGSGNPELEKTADIIE